MRTKRHRQIRNKVEKAIRDYRMIQPGDRLLIGVSGGPDSLALLKIFLDGFVEVKTGFSMLAVHIDLGLDDPEETPHSDRLARHFEDLGVEYHIEKTDIARLALDPEARKNPCFICSFHRRRKIYEIARDRECRKIVYGHHKDDIIETLLINILYGREIGCMHPVQPVFREERHIIRPLVYVDEAALKAFAEESGLPRLKRLCPMDGNTRRTRVKKLIAQLQQEEKYANIRENIFKSLYHVQIDFAPPGPGKNRNNT